MWCFRNPTHTQTQWPLQLRLHNLSAVKLPQDALQFTSAVIFSPLHILTATFAISMFYAPLVFIVSNFAIFVCTAVF